MQIFKQTFGYSTPWKSWKMVSCRSVRTVKVMLVNYSQTLKHLMLGTWMPSRCLLNKSTSEYWLSALCQAPCWGLQECRVNRARPKPLTHVQEVEFKEDGNKISSALQRPFTLGSLSMFVGFTETWKPSLICSDTSWCSEHRKANQEKGMTQEKVKNSLSLETLYLLRKPCS